jgi:5-methylcytosine-specific restriction protein A
MSIEEELARRLKERLTLDISVQTVSQGGRTWIILEPADLLPRYGFYIQMSAGPQKLEAEFAPAAEASGLAHEMALLGPSARSRFAERATECRSAGAFLRLELDGTWIDDDEPERWPSSWTKFVLRAEVPGSFAGQERLIADWAERLLALVLSLVPPAAAIEPDPQIIGLPEGAMRRVEVNDYERSPINRANCIAALGDSCLGCGANFGSIYGEIGQGFIHVHHTVPVSKLGSDYEIDPVKDLVPLCPNCHAMVHRRDPPYTVEELKIILGRAHAAPANATSTA